MVPGAREALYRSEESYGAKPVSGFVDATGGAGRRNATVAMLTKYISVLELRACYLNTCDYDHVELDRGPTPTVHDPTIEVVGWSLYVTKRGGCGGSRICCEAKWE
jgi:hypothetical protein